MFLIFIDMPQKNATKKELLSFKEWLYELFQDERGHVSIKPVIAMLGSFFLCGSMLANSLTNGAFNPSETLVDAVMVITSIGMGADSIDKFSRKKTSNPSYNNDGYQDGRYKGDYRRTYNNIESVDRESGEVSREERENMDV